MGIAYNPSIVTDGLVLCLDAANRKSYPGSGNTWDDLSGNDNHGTLTNGTLYSSDDKGVFVFDGVNDQINVNNSTSLNPTNGITLTSWFKFSTLPTAELGLFRKEGQWQLGLVSASTIRCLVGTNAISGWTVGNDTTYNFATGIFYNMIVTYNGSNLAIYVNGVSVKTATVTGTILTSTNPVKIGYHTAYLNGAIAFCGIYNRALSASEIQQNFNATRGRYGI